MTLTPEITITQIAAALRAIRKQRGWTLKEVEEISGGVWKAVVIGSYERCDRSLSLNKAVSLARFYEVPLDVLLGLTGEKENPQSTQQSFSHRLLIDMRAVSNIGFTNDFTVAIKKYLNYIVSKRRDWNGEILSLRSGDLSIISLISEKSESEIDTWMRESGLYFAR
jgi:transcriptional regulator with XRE-family HTH domain